MIAVSHLHGTHKSIDYKRRSQQKLDALLLDEEAKLAHLSNELDKIESALQS
ncbi:hypothetical protein [Nostoc sphaeroides]|uniref:Uncharacterized protein n=1 Tax=Nostoc sphaeroides CCNUC1 TaxID=2653204 RepID=A0A5P8W388_9NOSO|nr:hypothetical protein [Nostoc sphaeroides]MCC5630540.1 hypothetical protein [Nostoc sphaeroides CHAB 2801]QFS46499.1 hypothetical protein GXM_03980 [Nostoc sphaeroides CCNUC1]